MLLIVVGVINFPFHVSRMVICLDFSSQYFFLPFQSVAMMFQPCVNEPREKLNNCSMRIDSFFLVFDTNFMAHHDHHEIQWIWTNFSFILITEVSIECACVCVCAINFSNNKKKLERYCYFKDFQHNWLKEMNDEHISITETETLHSVFRFIKW